MVPNFLLSLRIAKRQKIIQKLLPDAVDLLVICVEAGLGLNQALQRVAVELRHAGDLLSTEISLMNLEVRAGTPRDQALMAMADRAGVADLSSLATMLVQTERFGTSIADSLRIHAESMRTQRQQRAEEAAAKTTIKMVFPLGLCIFPALLVVILGPAAHPDLRSLLESGIGASGMRITNRTRNTLLGTKVAQAATWWEPFERVHRSSRTQAGGGHPSGPVRCRPHLVDVLPSGPALPGREGEGPGVGSIHPSLETYPEGIRGPLRARGSGWDHRPLGNPGGGRTHLAGPGPLHHLRPLAAIRRGGFHLHDQPESNRMTASPIPPAPQSLAEAGISDSQVLSLLLKTLYQQGSLIGHELARKVALPFVILDDVLLSATQRHFVEVLGTSGHSRSGYRFEITDEGRSRAQSALAASRYVGPAPVPLEQFRTWVRAAIREEYPDHKRGLGEGLQ